MVGHGTTFSGIPRKAWICSSGAALAPAFTGPRICLDGGCWEGIYIEDPGVGCRGVHLHQAEICGGPQKDALLPGRN